MNGVGILNKKSYIVIIDRVFDIYIMMSVGNNMFNPDERDRQFKLIQILKQIVVKFIEDDYTVKMDKCNVKLISKLNKLLKEDSKCKKCQNDNHHNHNNDHQDDCSSSDEE